MYLLLIHALVVVTSLQIEEWIEPSHRRTGPTQPQAAVALT